MSPLAGPGGGVSPPGPAPSSVVPPLPTDPTATEELLRAATRGWRDVRWNLTAPDLALRLGSSSCSSD